MKECVYCGNEIKGNGIYFCEKCKEEIKTSGINTGDGISDWVIAAHWYVEENNGNYWKNDRDIPKEEKNLQFIRPIDYIRFDIYRKSIGADSTKFAMNTEHLNDMEKWYLGLAEKYGKEKEDE